MIKKIYTFFVELFTKFYCEKYPISKLPTPRRLTNINRIIIFSNTALGDTLMSTPAIVATRQSFPQAKITFFISKKLYPLFKNYEYVDDFLLYHKGYKKFITNLLKIRSLKPDLILMFHSNGPQDIPTALLSGAKYILKTPRNNQNENKLSAKLPFYAKQHFILARLDTLSYVTLQKYKDLTMKLPSKYHNFELKEKVGIKIGFQMCTSKREREWGVINFAKLAIMILQSQNHIEIFLTGRQTREKNILKKFIPLFLNTFIKKFTTIVECMELMNSLFS